jgi:hypothetical protein
MRQEASRCGGFFFLFFLACALSMCGRRRALSLYVPGLACGRRRVGVLSLYSVSRMEAWHAAGGVYCRSAPPPSSCHSSRHVSGHHHKNRKKKEKKAFVRWGRPWFVSSLTQQLATRTASKAASASWFASSRLNSSLARSTLPRAVREMEACGGGPGTQREGGGGVTLTPREGGGRVGRQCYPCALLAISDSHEL